MGRNHHYIIEERGAIWLMLESPADRYTAEEYGRLDVLECWHDVVVRSADYPADL